MKDQLHIPYVEFNLNSYRAIEWHLFCHDIHMNYGEIFERNKSWCVELNDCNIDSRYFYKVVPVEELFKKAFLRELLASPTPIMIECGDCDNKETSIVRVMRVFRDGIGRYLLEDIDFS